MWPLLHFFKPFCMPFSPNLFHDPFHNFDMELAKEGTNELVKSWNKFNRSEGHSRLEKIKFHHFSPIFTHFVE